MTDIYYLIHRIKICSHDDTLYLLEKISDNSGLFALNGNILFAAKNVEESVCQSIKTEYLHLETNIHISSFDTSAHSIENGCYNYIELFVSDTDEQIENIKAFVNVCRSFSFQKGEVDFITFFDSLVRIFQLPPEQKYKNLVGLYGELFVIKYFFCNLKKDLSKYWHTDGANSKIDIVTPTINIEVKTTTSSQLFFTIKHAQLFDNKVETYLAAVSITENNSGVSLDELIEEMQNNPDYCNSLSFSLNLEIEKRKVSPKEAQSRRFLFKSIRLYSAKDICPFPVIPDIISDLSYKIDLSGFGSEDIQTVIKKSL